MKKLITIFCLTAILVAAVLQSSVDPKILLGSVVVVGAVVTTDFLAGLLTNFRAIFSQELGDVAKRMDQYLRIATQFPSTTDQESYGWMGATPNMREWTDVRVYKAIKAYDYTLKNLHYEGTIEVDKDTLADDKYGLITPRVKALARRAIRHFNEKVFSGLDDGNATLAYDGIEFFDSTREIGESGNIDNILTDAYSGSASEIRTAIGAAIVAMATFKDDKGIPMGLVPNMIVCPPAMYIPILNALLPGVAGTKRPEAGYFDLADIIMSPWLDRDAADWYILCTEGEIKPMIFQMRQEPQFVSLDDPKSDHVFKNRTFLYGVDDRFAVGYGDPRTAIMIEDSG